MKKYIITLVVLICTSYLQAQSMDAFFEQADLFFKTNVTKGKVNYAQIKKNPEPLQKLIDLAKNLSVTKEDKNVFQAFYINMYNLSVIHTVIGSYPVASPLHIKGIFDRKKFNIAGKKITLNDLENKYLRKNFPQPARFHFALVCAGKGCPPIIAAAYLPQQLEKQLHRQTKLSLNNPDFIRVKGNKIKISPIFKWYREDFIKNGTLIDFINRFREEKIDAKAKISYYSYDWSLNDSK